MEQKSREEKEIDEDKDGEDVGDIQKAAEISPNKRFYRVASA